VTFDRQSPPDRAPGTAPRFHCHGRPGRLDPRRLSRAVDRLLGRHPELGGGPGTGGLSATFAHLDLGRVTNDESWRTADTVRWALGRCLQSGNATAALLVAYLDSGEQGTGHLMVAGRGPAIADAEACVALSEALLEVYRDLGPG